MNGTDGKGMKTEVSAAALFIGSLLRIKCFLSEDELHLFTKTLNHDLLDHYQHHWYPHAPFRGSAYRCLRINHDMDPLIGKAGTVIGLTQEQLGSMLPKELTLWVDPCNVSYRIGENGSTCALLKSPLPQPKSGPSADTSASCCEKLKTRRSNLKRFNKYTVEKFTLSK